MPANHRSHRRIRGGLSQKGPTHRPVRRRTGPPPGELRLHPLFPSHFLGNDRTLVVYLPPDYSKDSERRYPVLYLHDGQNLFDPSTAAFGVAWDAHTTADLLIHAGRIEPIILVGTYNTPDRIPEYTVEFDAAQNQGGKGREYARFVFEEVKQFIDSTYRTRPEREFTGVAGSSLGGLVSLTMARDHYADFALCGVMSPSLWWAKEQILRDLDEDDSWLVGMKFWVDMGLREGPKRGNVDTGVLRTRRLVERFKTAGLVAGRDYTYLEVVNGEHNEASWAARFDRVLTFFFGKRKAR